MRMNRRATGLSAEEEGGNSVYFRCRTPSSSTTMRFRLFLTYLSLLPLSACTRSCNDYDNNEEFAKAQLPPYTETGANTLGCGLGAQT